MGDLTDKGQRRRVRGEQQRPDHRGVSHLQWGQLLYDVVFELLNKVEKILKGSPVLIPSPSPLVKIQIMSGKACLWHKGKTLLGIVNKLFVFKSLLTTSSNVLPLHLSRP